MCAAQIADQITFDFPIQFGMSVDPIHQLTRIVMAFIETLAFGWWWEKFGMTQTVLSIYTFFLSQYDFLHF